jgi:CelD/BcsL family acetyltransferase involved in cellulose biosynthesis
MFSVAVCASLQELEALRPEWDALLDRTSDASVFDDWAWTEAAWRYGAPGKQPYVLTVRDATQGLVGVLPLARTTQRRVVRALEVIGCTPSGYPMVDYGGLVAARGAEATVWQAILGYLAAQRNWAILDLRNCAFGALQAEHYRQAAARRGWIAQVHAAERCPRLTLAPTFDGYLSTLSANARQQIRRKLRKLNEAGLTITPVDNEDTAARDATLETLFRFFEVRWSHTGGVVGLPPGQACRLHQRFAGHFAARGALDLRVVRSPAGETVGVIYNLRRGDTGYFYMIGLSPDPQWRPYSLGVCLLADSIAAAIGAGCSTFDLLRGDHDYKRHFGGQYRDTYRVTLYRYRWMPALEEAARRMRRRLSAGSATPAPPQPEPEAA